LGYVVSDSEIQIKGIRTVKNITETDSSLPVLVIGWKNAKAQIPDVRITRKQVTETLHWTFSSREKKSEYEKDLDAFITTCFNYLTTKVSYFFVDPIHLTRKSIKKVIKKLVTADKPIAYSNGRMIYIYVDKIILGIDLKLMKYLGLSESKIKSKVHTITAGRFDNSEIFNVYEDIVGRISNSEKYIPYLRQLDYE